MASLDLTPAVANKLKATSLITSVLPLGADGIISAFTLRVDNFPDTINLPCIVVKGGGIYGRPSELPHTQDTIMLQIYDTAPSPNHLSYQRIDQLVWECIKALDKQELVLEASYYSMFEIIWDNYISAALFDEKLKCPCKWVRFRAFMAINIRS